MILNKYRINVSELLIVLQMSYRHCSSTNIRYEL